MLIQILALLLSIPFLLFGTHCLAMSINELKFYPLSLLIFVFALLNFGASYLDDYLEKKWRQE